jgi:hypothetical protein
MYRKSVSVYYKIILCHTEIFRKKLIVRGLQTNNYY